MHVTDFEPKVGCIFFFKERKSNELVKWSAYNVKTSAKDSFSNAGYLIEEYVPEVAFS